MANPILDWIGQNFLLIYFFFMNLFLIIVIFRLRMVLGPFFSQTIRVAFGLMRDPNMFITLLNSRTAILEWRSYKQVVKLEPEESTSELVYVDRERGWTPVAPIPSKKGFLNLFGKKNPELNTIYTENFVPVDIVSTKSFYAMGRQMHIIYEGQTATQNPLENLVPDAQAKKAAIAVELQLKANKLLAIDEIQQKLATKDDVRNFGLLNLFILGIGIVAVIMMVMGLQGAVDTFAQFVQSTYEQWKPAIEQLLSNAPRVIIE